MNDSIAEAESGRLAGLPAWLSTEAVERAVTALHERLVEGARASEPDDPVALAQRSERLRRQAEDYVRTILSAYHGAGDVDVLARALFELGMARSGHDAEGASEIWRQLKAHSDAVFRRTAAT